MERRSSVRFAPSEIARMEKLVTHKKERVLDEIFCRKLAEEFNYSPGRVGSKALQAVQVQEWFRHKFPASTVIPPCLPTGSEEKALASQASAPVSEEKPPSSEENALAVDTSISNDIGEVLPDLPIDNIDELPEIEDMQFEARSAKDFAWYDIATFLAYRKLSSGEFEVRVRFQGFGAEEDEWINVRKAIRLQSIPLESSECRLIREGDLVLCFKESNDEALHFDAHVLEIQRKHKDGVPDLSEHGDVYDLTFGLGADHPPTAVALRKEFQRIILYQQSPQEDSALASILLRPWPTALSKARFASGDGGVESAIDRVRRVYIKTANDRMVRPEQQEAMIRRWPPTEVMTMDTDHSPFFSAPELLFTLIIKSL